MKLVSPIGSKSAVWENFGMPVYESNGVRRQDKEHVICKLCDAALKYTGNTTNMQKHIDCAVLGINLFIFTTNLLYIKYRDTYRIARLVS